MIHRGKAPAPESKPKSHLAQVAASIKMAVNVAPIAFSNLLVSSLGLGVLPVVSAILLNELIAGLMGSAADRIVIVCLMIIAAITGSVLAGSVQFGQSRIARAVTLAADNELHRALNERLLGLSKLEDPTFQDQIQVAKSTAFSGPVQIVTSAIQIVRLGVTLSGFFMTLLVINPLILLIVVSSAIPVFFAELDVNKRRNISAWIVGRAERRRMFFSSLLSSPHSAKEIRTLGLGAFFHRRMVAESQVTNAEEQRVEDRVITSQTSFSILGAGIAGAALLWAVDQVARGNLTLGELTIVVAAVAAVQGATFSIVKEVATVHQSTTSMRHYDAVINVTPDLLEPIEPLVVPVLSVEIRFTNVWFRYSEDLPWVLNGVSFVVAAGEVNAIVGLNGAGKSTVVKLLCRLYDPVMGSITWDGIDVRLFSIESYRARIGSIFQDFMEYELTVAENIGLGDLHYVADASRIEEAVRIAGADQIIARMPLGYRTMLTRMFSNNADREDSETGVVLSGGQAQRIALARALMRRECELFILDEPSAGLDAKAESETNEAVRRVRDGRTTLLISHKLSAVRLAAHVIVIDDGVTEEEGTHAELMSHGARYAELFRLQASGYLDAGDLTVPSASEQ
jgi:ATP-binding cassette subfamily B protein